MSTVSEYFGCLSFDDTTMKERLPKDTYKSLKKTIDENRQLDLGVANIVANAMKDWAVEHGCTHYTHWFQPLTGVTADFIRVHKRRHVMYTDCVLFIRRRSA